MRIVTIALAVHAPDEMSAADVSKLIDQMLDDGCTEMMNGISVHEQECRKLFFGPSTVMGDLENQPRPIEPECNPVHLPALDAYHGVE